MEQRLLLSSAAPLLSRHALGVVVREVKAIVSTLAKTGDTVQANAQLTALSSQIPSGSVALASAWQNDIALFRPHSPGSIMTTEKRILGDLYRDIQGGAAGASSPVSSSGPTTSAAPIVGTAVAPTPQPTPSLDSVRIENTTGLALVVTVHLEVPQNHQPAITETIPAQGTTTALFDFGSATNVFMTMDVSRADGSQSPPPFTNINLAQPISGYNGTLFTISLFGPYFNVAFS
jgi:hypothetical protein